MNWLSILDYLDNHALGLARTLVIAIVGFFIARWVKKRLYHFLEQHAANRTIQLYAVNIAYTFILIILMVILLGQLGVSTTSLIALLGASGITIGLALKDSFSNIASGFMIIILKPFKIGDLVEISGKIGTIDQINLITTRLKTANNEGIYVPNAKIFNDKIINKTFKETRRIDLSISISYSSDLLQAKAILNELIREDERILTVPTPTIAVKELADSAVVIAVRPWVNNSDYGKVRFSLLESIKTRFDQHGIVIPYPQMEVILHHNNQQGNKTS
ncbi:Small-conductance mechanosensitive channel [Piscirickettsia salmonis]|uniref:Small-conductance mechanosensitive channel n=1 Tax=Piscirickettsia salmonis TaxID=1238 RepID=A0A1L6TFA9_PISSA|nr:mechanosensitive ion channel domain-containing protein [Piscirickettsia salmonis]AKP72371.1 mechanosensitive ion channel family protein [Piscirickettsia salmonis LF-89 = ATCC VR-1361]ALB24180.1 Mechanosensitive ion channel protein MscS [Piscirickettsia salmonis]ALY03981.1 mechanosensitive ion channel family protein [Piscirickettsia salmonis]AMA43545.1 mechanosensitive ion channel family protein [Piscirickettsia salmonis]AOS36014.1 mechanosensitive ion channel family protein [Piscirickettsia